MTDTATERLRRSRQVSLRAWLVRDDSAPAEDPGAVPEEVRRAFANPVAIPVRIIPKAGK